MSEVEAIAEQARKIVGSGALGRSRSYIRLLEYLVECSRRDRRPKEMEIAIEVFRKGSEFDPNQDAFVRVYVHNLRQKLDKFYAAQPPGKGVRLAIPKGEYRLALVPILETVEERPARAVPPVWAVAVAVLLAVNLIVVVGSRYMSTSPGSADEVARSGPWAELLNDDLPLLVVVGDYFIFAELDEFGGISRLVREFDVNSSDDLDNLFVSDPGLLADYLDLDLTYLPQGSASALSELLRVVYAADKPVQISTMTEMRVADLKSHHILYVGYISALGTLMDFVFSASELRVGASFDELENLRTGESYTSGAGIPGASNYEDYGLVSTFPGPDGNQFLVVAGTRDSGLMHAAQAISTLADIDAIENALVGEQGPGPETPPAFEALYEVTGFDRMNLDAMLIYASPLDYRRVWGGELAVP